MTTLILASASSSRAQMLRDAGVPFEVHPAHVDEDSVKNRCWLTARRAAPSPKSWPS